MLVRVLLGITISDIDCGFKLFKREKLDGMELRAHGAMISTELMARVAGRQRKGERGGRAASAAADRRAIGRESQGGCTGV